MAPDTATAGKKPLCCKAHRLSNLPNSDHLRLEGHDLTDRGLAIDQLNLVQRVTIFLENQSQFRPAQQDRCDRLGRTPPSARCSVSSSDLMKTRSGLPVGHLSIIPPFEPRLRVPWSARGCRVQITQTWTAISETRFKGTENAGTDALGRSAICE